MLAKTFYGDEGNIPSDMVPMISQLSLAGRSTAHRPRFYLMKTVGDFTTRLRPDPHRSSRGGGRQFPVFNRLLNSGQCFDLRSGEGRLNADACRTDAVSQISGETDD